MKASIKPLDGKYYGTIIEIDFGDGYKESFKIWDNADFMPSERWLTEFGCTKGQYQNNDLIHFDGDTDFARDVVDICDSHFESDLTYQRALKVVSRINHPNNSSI